MKLLLKERYVRWVGIAVVAGIILLTGDDHLAHEPIWYQYMVNWVFTAVYWNGAYFIFMMLRRVFPHISQTVRRLLLTYLTLFIWMSVGGVPIKLVLSLCQASELLRLSLYTEYLWLNLPIALIVGTSYETVFFFERWKEAIRQNELLKNQQIRTQFEVLQNQMSPHFLFNSLNTLTTLIAEDQETAIHFTQKLSDVYRYILLNKENELVPLQKELAFAKDYLYLLKMRYPDNLFATFDIQEPALDKSLPPLTIQMLIENAIKHNIVSQAKPLRIHVRSEGDAIIVTNNLQLKGTLEKPTKTGLENIRKRYGLLGGRSITIDVSDETFVVAVPLLEVAKWETLDLAEI